MSIGILDEHSQLSEDDGLPIDAGNIQHDTVAEVTPVGQTEEHLVVDFENLGNAARYFVFHDG